MDWKSLFFNFEGRITRKPYWIGSLVLAFAELVVSIAIALVIGDVSGHVFDTVSTVIAIVGLYPSLALLAKRWHDRDKSGWWSLLLLIPLVGGIWVFVETGFLRGTVGANRFGADPLAG